MSDTKIQNDQLLDNLDLSANFEEIKEVASKNINSMLKDLQDFEEAIKTENIPDIYRIYKGRLHKELKETSNQNHEIDDLLSKKLHDSFTKKFPFMEHVAKISPTIHHYKIGSYYRERVTIGFDASIPEIFVMPEIDNEWYHFHPENREALTNIEKEIDSLDANFIAAQSELAIVTEQLKELENKRTELQNNKGFFGRTKSDEESETLEKKIATLQRNREKWLAFVENKESANKQKEQLMHQYEETRLKRAIVTKEFRLISTYFGSLEEMTQKLQAFLDEFLNPLNEGGVHHE